MIRPPSSWSKVSRSAVHYLLPVVAVLLISMIYYLGIYSERTGFVEEVLDPGLKRITQPVLNAFRGRPPSVLRLNIDLAETELDSLRAVREKALDEGWLTDDQDQRFSASIELEGRTVPIIINLLPGRGDRFLDDRWPFQVRSARSDSILPMRTFDLHPVSDATSLHAWLLQHALNALGSPAFGHEFTDLRFNDRDLGLYAMEGQLDSAVLVAWGLGQGPVLRFDDGLLNNVTSVMDQRAFPSAMPRQGEWHSAPILASRIADPRTEPSMFARHRSAVVALEDFRAGRVQPAQVFDVRGLARLLALCDVLGAQASISWWNTRFLADSVSGMLVLVPLRAISGTPIQAPLALHTGKTVRFPSSGSDFLGRLLSDPIVYSDYIAYLDTFSTDGWMEGLQQSMAIAFEEQLRIVRAEFPEIEHGNAIYLHNREVVQSMLRPKDLLLVYDQGDLSGQRHLAAANVHDLPVVIEHIFANGDTIALDRPMTLWPSEKDKPLYYSAVSFKGSSPGESAVELAVRVMGTTEVRFVKARSWSTFPVN